MKEIQRFSSASSLFKCSQWPGARPPKVRTEEFSVSLSHEYEYPNLGHHQLLPKVCISMKLEPGAGAETQAKYSNRGHRHPNQCAFTTRPIANPDLYFSESYNASSIVMPSYE